jgi:hypothetical protein
MNEVMEIVKFLLVKCTEKDATILKLNQQIEALKKEKKTPATDVTEEG